MDYFMKSLDLVIYNDALLHPIPINLQKLQNLEYHPKLTL